MSNQNRRAEAARRMEVVALYAAGETTTQIGARFGVSRWAISGTLKAAGVALRPNPNAKLTADQKHEVVDLYKRGRTARSIAIQFGMGSSAVRALLLRRGVVLRTHTLWHEAFDELTPDAAYWIGFLFADGTVSLRGDRVSKVQVALTAGDRPHLVKLREFLRSTHAIGDQAPTTFNGYVGQPSVVYTVTSDRLADRLFSLGRYGGPVDVELKRSHHFWRGVVDGDGTIGSYFASAHAAHKKPRFGLVGSRRLLDAFNEFLNSRGVTGLSVRPHKTIYGIGTTSGPAVRIIQLLYQDAPTALDRKAARADSILNGTHAAAASRIPAQRRPQSGPAQLSLFDVEGNN